MELGDGQVAEYLGKDLKGFYKALSALTKQILTKTKIPGLPDMSYGQFIMFNKSGDSVSLDAFQDHAFEEYRILFNESVKMYHVIDQWDMSTIFQSLFSITCDPGLDGSSYSITADHKCKGCGSNNTRLLETDLPEFSGEMKLPTHEHWNKLTTTQKQLKVDEAIKHCFAERGTPETSEGEHSKYKPPST